METNQSNFRKIVNRGKANAAIVTAQILALDFKELSRHASVGAICHCGTCFCCQCLAEKHARVGAQRNAALTLA